MNDVIQTNGYQTKTVLLNGNQSHLEKGHLRSASEAIW